jgi:DNA-binding transcriptional MerR regulator
MITFSSDQEMELLGWLEALRDAGITLDEIIQGLLDGSITTPVDISESEQDIGLSRVS